MREIVTSLLEKEIHKHPNFTILAFCTLMVGLGVFVNPFVLATDFETFRESSKEAMRQVHMRLESLEGAVCENQHTIQKTALEEAIRQTDSEVFNLERVAQEGSATDRDLKRLGRLRTSQRSLERELEDLLRDEDCGN
ncbi:MAG: hypothetical protein CME59_02220 [Halioglobus sp.]|nr:hypothetical protein [Halioglobus sp.]